MKQYGYVLTEGIYKGALIAVTKAENIDIALQKFEAGLSTSIWQDSKPVVVKISLDIQVVE